MQSNVHVDDSPSGDYAGVGIERPSGESSPPRKKDPRMVQVGEKLYEANLRIVNIVDFGLTLEEAQARGTAPPEGARWDVHVSGTAEGILAGTVEAVDYVQMRADGRSELHIHGVVTTPDGARVSLAAVGAGSSAEDGIVRLTEYVTLHAAAPQYAWVNPLPVRAEGTLNMATGELSVSGYAG
jgi:hypothetical protein